MFGDMYDKLTEYSKSDYYPLHMPGHKRKSEIDNSKYGFNIDITEIDDFDNLYCAEEIIKDAMENAAGFYGTYKTYFLVNGSSSGILTAIHATTNREETLLIGRNCHKSVYNGSQLLNTKNVYLYPEYLDEYGINGGYSIEKIEKLFEKNKEIRTVIITSPTYDGIVSDISAISEIVHKNNAILIVDEAHGAHFGVSEKFPEPAYMCGADIVIESTHKTLPAFTQTALLHISKEGRKRIDVEKLEYFWSVFQTSSPSYVFMANIDRCTRILQKNGKALFNELDENINSFRKRCEKLVNVRIPGKELVGKHGIYDIDLSKIIVNSSDCNFSGKDIYDMMRKKYHIQMELHGAKYALGIMTVSDSKEVFDRVYNAIEGIDNYIEHHKNSNSTGNIENKEKNYKIIKEEKLKFNLINNEAVMRIYDVLIREKLNADIYESEGEIAAEYLYLYPPGIPMLVPGERVSKELINQIREYELLNYEIKGKNKFKIIKK